MTRLALSTILSSAISIISGCSASSDPDRVQEPTFENEAAIQDHDVKPGAPVQVVDDGIATKAGADDPSPGSAAALPFDSESFIDAEKQEFLSLLRADGMSADKFEYVSPYVREAAQRLVSANGIRAAQYGIVDCKPVRLPIKAAAPDCYGSGGKLCTNQKRINRAIAQKGMAPATLEQFLLYASLMRYEPRIMLVHPDQFCGTAAEKGEPGAAEGFLYRGSDGYHTYLNVLYIEAGTRLKWPQDAYFLACAKP